ncbi:NAD(P)/FAD-dependent oxidoreductase [Halomonas binhaiensis]|uniref:FAD-binding oxidoreductase n=1 Tax=Halomonas binhaiensis TaxID=2562282 RepID=A0A5C1NHV0_9GAMM|nr:FAD-dependent oxidoreductase [Halomonas binhaiensis]QEM82243.1 FAD-binding oxidoreductase [Halomonas binhaiensis]
MGPPNQVDGNAAPQVDITVVGAGIIGICCALALARQGLKVQVLDKQAPGMGASFGNAGHMATEQVFPIADASILTRLPGMLMDPMGPLRLDWRHLPRALPWFTRLLLNLRQAPYAHSVRGIRALNEVSLCAWHKLLDTAGGRHLLKSDGSFLVHETPDTATELQAIKARMADHGVTVEAWKGDAIRERAPELSARVQGGLFFPDTGHVVNPYSVSELLVAAARQHGVCFHQREVTRARLSEHGVTLTTADSGTIQTPRVLLACGAHSAPLTAELTGVRVPLDTERGYHLMLPREAHRLPLAVTSLERRFIMTPMREGLRLAGTVEFAGLQRPANMQRAWQLHRLTQGLFRDPLSAEGATPWMGFRPSLPDSLPIIDSVQHGKVLLAFGHHHLGLTQAAITAEMIATLATPERTPSFQSLPEPAPYRLNRF